MRRRTWFALAILCVVLAWSESSAEDKSADILGPRSFPMKVGAKWTYAYNKTEVTFEALRREKLDDTDVFVVRRTIDSAAVEFKLSVQEHGVYIHQEGDRRFEPPLRQFPFFTREGDRWKWRGTDGGKERAEEFQNLGPQEVTVPAGKFPTVLVQQQTSDGEGHVNYWLSPGVGVVQLSGKTESLAADAKGFAIFEWRLKKYEPGE